MDQIHKRFTAEQVKVLLKGYCQGILERRVVEETLGINKSTFFALLKGYRCNPDEFSLAYHRETPTRIPARVEKEIERVHDREVITTAIGALIQHDASHLRWSPFWKTLAERSFMLIYLIRKQPGLISELPKL
jgi:hypothetical protein